MCAGAHGGQQGAVDSPRAGVTRGSEFLYMDARNQTQILQNSKHS